MRDVLSCLLLVRSESADARRRGRIAITVAIGLIAAALLLFLGMIGRQGINVVALGLTVAALSAVEGGAILLARAGHVDAAGVVTVAISTAAIHSGLIVDPDVPYTVFILTIPLCIAGVLLRPR